jgi:pantoate--beta-alanine ligase
MPGSMKVFREIQVWQKFRKTFNETLGFVPTMGALHRGHISLVEKSLSENALTLVSIFVNPTQFDQKTDLEKYPRTIEQDLNMLEEAGADFVLAPTALEMYPDQFKFCIDETELSTILCGASRPGHFRGMLTVVMKLLQLARAKHAYFGKKDFQQLLLVQQMAEAFFLETKIIGCEIVRESSGLAMSSRNQRLAPSEREKASLFSKILTNSSNALQASLKLEELGFKVDYVEDKFNRRLGAIQMGDTRLIDNVET